MSRARLPIVIAESLRSSRRTVGESRYGPNVMASDNSAPESALTIARPYFNPRDARGYPQSSEFCTSSNLLHEFDLVHTACRAFSHCSAALERSDNNLISLIVRCR
jgi:hypothetical protein